MNNKSIRSSKSLLLGVALGVLASGGLAGCAEEPADTGPEPSVRNVLVTAESIAELAPGEMLTLDLADERVVFHIDYSKAPIDYARIVLSFDDGTERPLTESMTATEARDHNGSPASDLHATADKRFLVASNPMNFGVLDEVSRSELETHGYYIKQTSGPPASQPQSTDNCIYAVCVTCNPSWVDVPQNVPRDYIYEQHVWCD